MKKRTIQALPAKLIDPRPVLLSGIGAWIVCLMTLLIVGVKTTAMWTAVWGIACLLYTSDAADDAPRV